jgi:G3E family GTPase
MKLPLTVISGYLGAGKTSLINRLLAEDHGLRLLVLVNDFGSINVDASLLRSASDDTVALTNGCVCCTMDNDLFMALGQALDRNPRPDHIIIEASGIADPAAIANTAIAEPELGYAGIITVVDAINLPTLLDGGIDIGGGDVAAQVAQQITAADAVLITKSPETPPVAVMDQLTKLGARSVAVLGDQSLSDLLLDVIPLPRGRAVAVHPAYVAWEHSSDRVISRETLGRLIETRPKGLYRLKGTLLSDDGGYEIHIVGQNVQAKRSRDADRTVLVGLGSVGNLTRAEVEQWWQAAQ